MGFKLISLVAATGAMWSVSAQAQTPTSCASILNNGLSNGDGVYTIDPDGNGANAPFSVWCDMTTDGGGWTVIANNDNGDVEPSGCWARIGSHSTFVCGNISQGEDFVVPAYGMVFDELVWATYDNDDFSDISAYQYMLWNNDQTIPNNNGRWSLSPNSHTQTLNGHAAQSKIFCTYYGTNGLRLVGNEIPNNGDYGNNPVTIFDEDNNLDNPGHMSFTEKASNAGSMNGLDDFQDGHGCGDSWQPKADRGKSSYIMIRGEDPQVLVFDADSDGVNDDVDNCPNNANADQADGDADGIGDVCDACPADATNDEDGDGVCQDVDNCPTVANADQADDNGDGYGDACVSTAADIAATATLGNDIVIGAGAVIGAYARIDDGATVNGAVGSSTIIGAGSVVPAGATVGNAVVMGANVGLGTGCNVEVLARLGSNITAGANCFFGSKADVGDNTSFGANTSVGILAVVGAGSSFADDAAIGNNSQVGASADLLAGSSIESNTRVGHTLSLGAGAIIEGNTEIGDEAIIGANGVVRSYVTIGHSLAMGAGAEFASGAAAGDDATIGENTEVRGSLGNNVTLEDRVFIGNQSSVGDNGHMHHDTTLGIFVTVESGCTIHDDSALYDGVTLGADSTVGERSTILFRSTIGARASIGDDVILDEQNTVGTDLVLGNNSRLWPRSTYGNNVNIGANVLIRDTADIGSDVTIEDNVIIFPETTIGEETTIRQGVELGVAVCETQVCGQVTIGGCLDINTNVAPQGLEEGSCQMGLVIDVDTGARKWADGTYATSCNDYRYPMVAPYVYADNIGDGRYTIDPDGVGGTDAFDVYCDMTTDGGGWTMVDNDATNAATFVGRSAGANDDPSVTRGAVLPNYTWSDSPQLLCRSNSFNGTLDWVTFNALSATALSYPTDASGNASDGPEGGHWSYGELNGNTATGTTSWTFVGNNRSGGVWIGSNSHALCACNYTNPSGYSGLGGTNASPASSTCSTWVR
ncbi:MAG: fibrinogen-like YCDxxxxGGGW domain-containing protein [Bradymonadia bacterium]